MKAEPDPFAIPIEVHVYMFSAHGIGVFKQIDTDPETTLSYRHERFCAYSPPSLARLLPGH